MASPGSTSQVDMMSLPTIRKSAYSDHSTSSMDDVSSGDSARQSTSAARRDRDETFEQEKIYTIIPGKLSFAAFNSEERITEAIRTKPEKFFFSGDWHEMYQPFNHDTGPVPLGIIHGFLPFMRHYWNHASLANRELIYYTDGLLSNRTNAALILACYIILELQRSVEQSWQPFACMPPDTFASFRDTQAKSEPDHFLSITACLRGLHKAVQLGWYNPLTFDLDEYEFLDNPQTADLHMLTDRIAAFCGPSARLSCKQLAVVLKQRGFTTVVRITHSNSYAYDVEDFVSEGLRHFDLTFEGGNGDVPDDASVARFADIVSHEEGKIAVHCRFAGLGPSSALIGAWMITTHHFMAEDCIGWLRISRPGSVFGNHLMTYLERVGDEMSRRHRTDSGPSVSGRSDSGPSVSGRSDSGPSVSGRSDSGPSGSLSGSPQMASWSLGVVHELLDTPFPQPPR